MVIWQDDYYSQKMRGRQATFDLFVVLCALPLLLLASACRALFCWYRGRSNL